MANDRTAHYALIILFLIVAYFAVVIIIPFWAYIFFALLLAFAFYPVSKRLKDHIPNDTLRALIMLALVLFLIIVPTAFITINLINQGTSAWANFRSDEIEQFIETLPLLQNQSEDVQEFLAEAQINLKHTVVDGAQRIIGQLPSFFLGLFIMFFIMFYAFKEGRSWYYYVLHHVPLKNEVKMKIAKEIRTIVQGVLYGQLLTALVQALIGTIILWSFGIPSWLFWGFLMIIAAFIPYVGTLIIWGPAAIFMILADYSWVAIIAFVALNATITGNIDNVLRPYLIGREARLHTALALLGVLGGLAAFGISGMVIGPIVMALFFVLLRIIFVEKPKESDWVK